MTEKASAVVNRVQQSSVVDVGVIGVGSMGENHARVYRELQGTRLVGVADLDDDRANQVAEANLTDPLPSAALIEAVDAVSVAVPTPAHFEVTKACIEAGVDVLVEKPFVASLDDGRMLARMAREHDVVLQVGHIERFNPAVQSMLSVADGLNIIATAARRVGPPVDRPDLDGVIMDLMVHDLDVVLELAGAMPSSIDAVVSQDGQYATAILTFPNDSVCTLTASRVNQRRIRDFEVTANECQIAVDYLDQGVHIYRQSRPEYTREDGFLRHRSERVIERPIVEHGEPLKNQLASFVAASRSGEEPSVTADDGLRVIEVAQRILDVANETELPLEAQQ